MSDKKEQIEFLEWLIDDAGCDMDNKIPFWAKTHIVERIQDLKSEESNNK